MNTFNIASATTAQLVEFFNANCATLGIKPVARFADRKTAERRVASLISDLEFNRNFLTENVADPSDVQEEKDEAAPAFAEGNDDEDEDELTHAADCPPAPVGESLGENFNFENYTCPSCQINLGNGVGRHGQEVNGEIIKHEKYEFCCLACGDEFGPKIAKREVDANRSAAIAASWCDADVALARTDRHRVRANGVEYRSVRQAFIELGLPLAKHIKFRMALKAALKLEFNGVKFEIVEI